MKKTLAFLALALSLTTFANADVTPTACNCVSTTITMASNYVYRAMSYNSQGTSYQAQGSPVVQASMDFYKNNF